MTLAEVDQDVVAGFRAGEIDALGAIYDRYSRPVWSVAMSVLRDRSLADDATQETFLRVWRAAPTFDPGRDLAPWLLTIARRTAIDVYRREARATRGRRGEQDDVLVELPAVDAPGIEKAWETWEVRLALEELPEEERVVVQLSHFDELSHREIADKLAVPMGTVKSRSHRAHRRLALRLAHLMDPPQADETAGGPR